MVKEGNIVIDVGNSSIKTGKFINDQLVACKVFQDLNDVVRHFEGSGNYDWIIASVGRKYDEIKRITNHLQPVFLTQNTALPISLHYDTPETLGVDRIAVAAAANMQHPNKNVLVIDAGTCITYDIVDKHACFQGGVIAPGLSMRMRAMHQFTSKLPDISEEWQQLTLRSTGKSTRESMLNGSFSAIIHEMQGFIDQFVKEYGQLIVLITGGDAGFFESNLKPHIFADSNLVLTGLNRILNYNK